MPNHVYHRLCISGGTKEDQLKMREKIRGEEQDQYLDFYKIIPMPKELLKVDEDGRSILTNEDKAHNLEKYGSEDWYDWSCKHWGTKWNAYGWEDYDLDNDPDNQMDDHTTYMFMTAWSFPTPIAVELSKMFPNMEFEWASQEECGSFDFIVTYKNGKVISYGENEVIDEETGECAYHERKPEDFPEMV